MIEVVTQYKCPVTGKLWPTEKQAKDCAARVKAREKKKLAEQEEKKKLAEEKEFRRNFVRLNAKSPANAFELLLGKSEEFWGVKFELKNPEGLDWSRNHIEDKLCSGTVEIKAEITNTELHERYYREIDSYWGSNISSFLGYIGFDTGSGNPGNFKGYIFRMGIQIPFKNFPVISENCGLVKSERDKLSRRERERDAVRRVAGLTATRQPEYLKMADLLDAINELYNDLRAKKDEYTNNFADRYVRDFWDKSNPAPIVNSELLEMFSNVR